MFNALVVEKDAEGRTSAAVQELADDRLPEGEVTVAVAHSTVNYKDGLCLGPGAGLVKTYPHVPGIDFAGTVEASDDPRYKPGDKVVLTGWHVGERHWGGYAERARVRADWLVPLPDGLTTRQAMAVGTAGFRRARTKSRRKQGMRREGFRLQLDRRPGGTARR
jgi:acrylyl-CoA reductase (NADPH)